MSHVRQVVFGHTSSMSEYIDNINCSHSFRHVSTPCFGAYPLLGDTGVPYDRYKILVEGIYLTLSRLLCITQFLCHAATLGYYSKPLLKLFCALGFHLTITFIIHV